MTEERKPFERQYAEEQSPKELRDRFQVELTTTEREILRREDLSAMQVAIWEHQDAAAVKFWAMYGWLSYSNQAEANRLFRDTLFKNALNKKRLGVDVDQEIRDKFQQRMADFGGNLQR